MNYDAKINIQQGLPQIFYVSGLAKNHCSCFDKKKETFMCNQSLPKCWATSRISLGLLSCTSKAFNIGGRLSSNCTSTTAPMTATTRPLMAPAAAFFGSAAYLRSEMTTQGYTASRFFYSFLFQLYLWIFLKLKLLPQEVFSHFSPSDLLSNKYLLPNLFRTLNDKTIHTTPANIRLVTLNNIFKDIKWISS